VFAAWCVEGVGDAVLSNDASQVSTRHTDLSNDVRELWVLCRLLNYWLSSLFT